METEYGQLPLVMTGRRATLCDPESWTISGLIPISNNALPYDTDFRIFFDTALYLRVARPLVYEGRSSRTPLLRVAEGRTPLSV